MPEIRVDFRKDGDHADKQTTICKRGVWLEQSHNSEEAKGCIEGIVLELKTYGEDIDEQMNGENHEEKIAEMVKHLCEKVPPHPRIGGEIWKK